MNLIRYVGSFHFGNQALLKNAEEVKLSLARFSTGINLVIESFIDSSF